MSLDMLGGAYCYFGIYNQIVPSPPSGPHFWPLYLFWAKKMIIAENYFKSLKLSKSSPSPMLQLAANSDDWFKSYGQKTAILRH
jgi:hypothetical protein